jgi:hypothetical protein
MNSTVKRKKMGVKPHMNLTEAEYSIKIDQVLEQLLTSEESPT